MVRTRDFSAPTADNVQVNVHLKKGQVIGLLLLGSSSMITACAVNPGLPSDPYAPVNCYEGATKVLGGGGSEQRIKRPNGIDFGKMPMGACVTMGGFPEAISNAEAP